MFLQIMNEPLLLVYGRMSITIYYIILRALGYDRPVTRPRALSDNARSYERACLMMRDHTWVHVRPSVTGREGLYDWVGTYVRARMINI